MNPETKQALLRMEANEEIKMEARDLAEATKRLNLTESSSSTLSSAPAVPVAPKRPKSHAAISDSIPLNWRPGQGGHKPSDATRQMLAEVTEKRIRQATQLFYSFAFQDPVLDRFIRDRNDPHGERFSNWILEKFGDESHPWSYERIDRKTCPFSSHGRTFTTPHDRSSAHYAAWHSPKRPREHFGRHFKLDDCRTWMRLHFAAFRAAGCFEACPAFESYYIRFIGHFVSVYERAAPPFARNAARWSAEPGNFEEYVKRGRTWPDITGVSVSAAVKQLPIDERPENDPQWPYHPAYLAA